MNNFQSENSSLFCQKIGIRWDTFAFLAALAITAIIVLNVAIKILPEWDNVGGAEAYSIAKSISSGKGFSFPAEKSWLFGSEEGIGFRSTAWREPLYTYILAGIIFLFGDYHKLAAAIFNLSLLFTAFVLLFRLGRLSASPTVGLIAVLLLGLNTKFTILTSYMNGALLAVVLVLISGHALLRFYLDQSNRNACFLGLALGITCLGCPSAQLFIPATGVSILALYWRNFFLGLRFASISTIFAILVISPWTIRNYIQFGELVPLRTGSGQIIFIGTVGLAGTVEPFLLRSSVVPPWSASSPRKAVRLSLKKDHRSALEKFQMDYMLDLIPNDYHSLNEAQRDFWFLSEAKNFLIENPKICIRIGIANLEAFTNSNGKYGIFIAFLSIMGGILSLKRWFFCTNSLWVVVYVSPFMFIITYFPRYRSPIEPLLSFLAAFGLWYFSLKICKRSRGK